MTRRQGRNSKTDRQQRPKCIFCGSTGGDGNCISGEHIWSSWSHQYVQFPGDFDKRYIQNNDRLGFVRGASEQSRPRSPLGTQIRVVCKKCNNGWMKTIEDKTRPFLKEIIAGNCSVLSESEQIWLRKWLFLKAIISESLWNSHAMSNRLLTKRFARSFYLTQEVPEEVRIWASSHQGVHWQSAFRRYSTVFSDTGNPLDLHGHNIQLFTFGCGNLISQVFAASTICAQRVVQAYLPVFRELLPSPIGSIDLTPSEELDDIKIWTAAKSFEDFGQELQAFNLLEALNGRLLYLI